MMDLAMAGRVSWLSSDGLILPASISVVDEDPRRGIQISIVGMVSPDSLPRVDHDNSISEGLVDFLLHIPELNGHKLEAGKDFQRTSFDLTLLLQDSDKIVDFDPVFILQGLAQAKLGVASLTHLGWNVLGKTHKMITLLLASCD